MTAAAAPVRLGVLRLVDAAPAFVAAAAGLFSAEGVPVELSVEPSWANVADKLAYGLLEAAVLPPPLALAVELGLRGPAAAPLVVPMAVSLNGNAVVLAGDLAGAVLDGAVAADPDPLAVGRRLAGLARARPRPPRLAVVHAFSTHDLLLRYWLAASGLDPERDVELVVVPPAEAAAALAAGRIEGFCAGAPWGAVAAAAGAGRAVVRTRDIWRNHPEKCLAVRAAWAERRPDRLQALLRALLRAGARCDGPDSAPAIAALLADPSRVGVPAGLIAPSLGGPAAAAPDRVLFAAHAATFPWRSHAAWFAARMARGRELPADAPERARRLYRPDLWAAAARALALPVPLADAKPEGGHAAPWLLPADPEPIPMLPEDFCDGARFEG